MIYAIAEPCIANIDNSCVEVRLPEIWALFARRNAEYFAHARGDAA